MQVARDSAFTTIEFSATLTGTSVTTTSLADGQHFWHVRARDIGAFTSAYSSTFSFTTSGAGAWHSASPGSDTGGGISNTPPNSVDPVLAINPATNLPGIAWTAPNTAVGANSNPAIYFRELVGGTWTEFAGSGSTGGVSNNNNPNQYPSLAYEASGTPVIAWETSGTGSNTVIFVRAFTGGAWSELSASGSGNGISGGAGAAITPSIAINPVSGQPGVAWSQFFSGTFRAYFREYNGTTTWNEFAGSGSNRGLSNDNGNAFDTSLTYDSTGAPIVAWADDTSGTLQIYARRFSGGAWQDLSGSSFGGGISNNAASNRHPSVQTDNANDIFVVWEETPTGANSQVFGRSFNGASWGDFATGSATGGGISGTTGGAHRPVLSKSPTTDKTFLMVWNDGSDPDGMPEVYAKYYSLGLWRQIGGNSALFDGISSSSVPTSHPWCGIAGGATPTAYACWEGGAASAGQIYVRSILLTVLDDSPKEVVAAGGQGSGGQYRVFSNGAVTPPYAPLSLRTLPWAAYDAANGTLHPACGDVEGSGTDDVVLGLGTYTASGGWVAVLQDNSATFGLLAWLRFPWAAYNAANGEVFPACGDLYGTGISNIVLGQGSFPGGGGGWSAVFGNARSGFPYIAWIHGGTGTYDAANGAVYPSCGDLDGDGSAETVLGFGSGGAGLAQVLNDGKHGFATMGWMTYPNSGYDSANGTTWPTVTPATLNTKAGVVLGPGNGGGGVAYIYAGPGAAFGRTGSLVLPWSAYDTAAGDLRLASGTTDGSGYPAVVAGLASYPSAGGWLYVFANVTTGSPTGTWIHYVPASASYNSTNGETFPAVGQLR